MDTSKTDGSESPAERLSYKFQRLRERLRAAIESGELQGKLPGERQLAKRFRVNAKTLSKALTDLAAEGLLDRVIGLGTFVKGSTADAGVAPAPKGRRWLVVCTDESRAARAADALRQGGETDVRTAAPGRPLRPSEAQQVDHVIAVNVATSDPMLRDLVVRGTPLVLIGVVPQTYSTHSVVVDRTLGAQKLARELVVRGHRRLFVVETGEWGIAEALRRMLHPSHPELVIESGTPADVADARRDGANVFICETIELARDVARRCGSDASLPQPLLTAVGCVDELPDIPGCYVTMEQKVRAALELLSDAQRHKPATLWLTGDTRLSDEDDEPDAAGAAHRGEDAHEPTAEPVA